VKKQFTIESWLEAIDPCIICINKTWLNSNVRTSEVIDDKNFTVFRNVRGTGRGGGVMLAIKPHLQTTRLSNLEHNAEIIWSEIRVNGSKIMIGSAYRSPSNCASENDELIASLNSAANDFDNYDACILTGDLNLGIDWSTRVPRSMDSLGNKFLNVFYNFVPHQLVDSPTRLVGDNASLIDLLLCDDPNIVQECNVILGVSDHCAISATLILSASK
jgi:hypothetical protein